MEGSKATAQTTIGSYVFQQRTVPPPPSFLRAENSRLLVERDDESNSWVWMGSPVLGSQILDLARAYDKVQTEMDLEFVLVLLNTEKVRQRGVSVFYSQSASWLDMLSLQGDVGSLRISSGGWAAELSLQHSDLGASVISLPVVRVLDGRPWEFATGSDVPVPRSEIVDGVIRQFVDYRPIDFGLSGVVRIIGDKHVILEVQQRNGSIATTSVSSSDVPSFATQTLQTSVKLAWWEWSVLGGIQVDREEIRKGLFRRSTTSTSDYLVIFVRPRLALDAPPAAVPARRSRRDVHPLLPDKGEIPLWMESGK